MPQDDRIDELELIADIEKSRARQHEGRAREAEAHERALRETITERRQLRAETSRRERLSSFLDPRRLAEPLDLPVIEIDRDGGVR